MYKFGQIEIESKKFDSVYQVQNDVDCRKIRISEGVVANKHDTRYTIGYETEPGVIVPLYVKTLKGCLSSGVSRFNEASPWKMGLTVSEDEAWVKDYEAIWITNLDNHRRVSLKEEARGKTTEQREIYQSEADHVGW